jgi:pimeloyl-ACP methyl ester carboxylesterase
MIALADRGNFRIPSLLYGLLELEDASDNLGVYYSVQCAEDAPFTTLQQVLTAANALNPVVRPDILSSQTEELRVCQGWHVKPAPSAQRQPVTSAIPTLVLSGEYDPITPPADSLQAAKMLSHSYRFVFPGIGHGVFQNGACPDSIVMAFVAHPTHRPDGSCIATMTEPKFLVPSQG